MPAEVDIGELALQAVRATALDATLARAEVRIRELQAQLVEAEAMARDEVADLQDVSSGLHALWLRLKGEYAETVAKEEAEARAAVALLASLRSELLGLVEERDAAKQEREALADAPERFERALDADTSAAERLVRAQEAVSLARELARRLDAAAQLVKRAGEAKLTLNRHDSSVEVPSMAKLEVCQSYLDEVLTGLDALDEALAAAGCEAKVPLKLVPVDLSVAHGTFTTVFTIVHLFTGLREAIAEQRTALEEAATVARRQLAALAAEREANTLTLADSLR